MSIKPILHRILVKPVQLDEVDDTFKRAKAAGIAMPELNERSREQAAISEGVVIDIGATAFKDFGATDVIAIGDYIVYAKHSGRFITDKVTKEIYVLLNDEDCLSVIKE